MESKALYLIAADVVLIIHTLFAAFVVFGLVLILVGKPFSWSWIHNPWFRLAHLAGIGIVVVQAWLGMICPLTDWEMALRSKADGSVYTGSFIEYWLSNLLYFEAPEWVFTLCYTLFGLLVGLSWLWVRPTRFKRKQQSNLHDS